MSSVPTHIADLNELLKLLGDEFVVFCGSAVSGFNQKEDLPRTFLPMVGQVLQEFLGQLSEQLKAGSYYEQTVAAYAQELAHGRYSFVREGVKFEEFILIIERVLGADYVRSMLSALYLCDVGQYTPNHSAIGHLLGCGRAMACLTTNFDNAIERAYTELTPYVAPNRPDDLTRLARNRSLLKLHGDVVSGAYVATTQALYTAEVEKHYDYVEDLLKHRVVFVLGYSGKGDVDIVPHLKELEGAKLIWAVHNDPPPDFATHEVGCDLAIDDHAQNHLLGLAAHYGWTGSAGLPGPDWSARLKSWFGTVPPHLLTNIIRELLLWKAAWTVIHMDQVRQWEVEGTGVSAPPESYWERGHAQLGVTNYITAGKFFRQASVTPELEAKLIRWKGYTEWRLGDLEEALTTLRPVVFNPQLYHDTQDLAECRRTYLEVGRDLIRKRRSPSERQEVYACLALDAVIGDLSRSRQTNVESDLWTQAIITEVRYLMAQPVDVNDLRRVFQECLDLQQYTAAQTVACVLVTIDFRAGLKSLWQANRLIWKSIKNWHPLRKSVTTALYAILPMRLRLSIILDLFDGPILAKAWASRQEKSYMRKLKKWRVSFDEKAIYLEV